MKPRRQLVSRALLAGALLALAVAAGGACNNTPPLSTGGDFVAPTGLAIASAADRDFLFIANAGASDLKILNICNTPTDGGSTQGNTTCPVGQDFRFVPGPIRVFPASVPVGTRPIRLAGLRLLAPGFGADGGSLDGGVQGTLSDGGPTPIFGGAALVAGAEPALYVVDTNTILDTEFGVAKTLARPTRIVLDALPIDVIASERPGQLVRAFALTLSEGNVNGAQLLALSATLNAKGNALVQIDARCALPIIPTRLALIPGRDDLLYVADGSPDGIPGGKGDGALELKVADILALANGADGGAGAGVPACPAGRRIAATDTTKTPPRSQPLIALALNPEVVADLHAVAPADGGTAVCSDGGPPAPGGDLCDPVVTMAAGAMLLGVTASPGVPLDPTDPNAGREAGRIVFLRTATADVAPRPPHSFFEGTHADGGVPPKMEGLGVNGLAREVAFLTPPPREKCPPTHPDRPCGLIVVGGKQTFAPLIGAATSSDGATYFIEADGDDSQSGNVFPHVYRRFYNDGRDDKAYPGVLGPTPALETVQTLTPSPAPGIAPTTFTKAPIELDANKSILRPDFWFTAGVSRRATWKAVFHAGIPGLDHAGALMTRLPAADGSTAGYRLQLPGVDLRKFTGLTSACGTPGKYCLGVGVGDFVSFISFTPTPGAVLCDQLISENGLSPRELPITAIGIDTLDLGPEATAPPVGLFDPSPACFPSGVTVEVRVGHGVGDRPWLVFEGNELRGRAQYNQQFIGYEPRFDYPLSIPPTGELDATPWSQNVGASFTIGPPADGSEPIAKTTWFFSLQSGQGQTQVRDSASFPGLAGAVIVYNSPKVTNLVFTAITGANSVLQVDPALIGISNSIQAYR